MEQKKIIIFDIDGTVANCSHRQIYVQNKPKNWPAFNRYMHLDTPHNDIIWLYKLLAAQDDTIMLIVSGRGAENRAVTEQWLADNGLVYEGLYMRNAKDSRSDNIVKTEILTCIRMFVGEPYMVFDDRDQVVRAWRDNGVRCLQVADGNF